MLKKLITLATATTLVMAFGSMVYASDEISLDIGESTLDINLSNNTADIDNGDVYYVSDDMAYISVDLDNQLLSSVTDKNSNNINDLYVDNEGIQIKYNDNEEYTIKVQDQSKFLYEPEDDVIYPYDFRFGQVVPMDINANIMVDEYTSDNGLFSFATGDGSRNPYWFDTTHGLELVSGNYFDVEVGGDSKVVFNLCEYGSGGTIDDEIIYEGDDDLGYFNSRDFKGEEDGDTITYTYTGEPRTIRFTITNDGGTSYLHGITVYPDTDKTESNIVNQQTISPMESNAFMAVGQQFYGENLNESDDKNMIFPTNSEDLVISGNMTLNGVTGTSDDSGIFVDVFNSDTSWKLGLDGTSAIYSKESVDNKSENTFDIGSTVGDRVPFQIEYKDGIIKRVIGDKSLEEEMTGSANIALDIEDGFGAIDNLIIKSNGEVVFDQSDAYNAIGTAPIVTDIGTPVVSEDRLNVALNWSGENIKDDEYFLVEVAINNGGYKEVTKTKENSIVMDLSEDGRYIFRVTGICGDSTIKSMISDVINVTLPLDLPIVTVENRQDSLEVDWQDIEGADKYTVYRKSAEDKDYTVVDEVVESMYTDTNVTEQMPYYYKVVAANENNTSNVSESAFSVATGERYGEYSDNGVEVILNSKSKDTVLAPIAKVILNVNKDAEAEIYNNDLYVKTVNLYSAESNEISFDLAEGRNDIYLLIDDGNGNTTKETYNFVYLTNYDILVDPVATPGIRNDGVIVCNTVQEAVDTVDVNNTEEVVVFIKEGSYKEYLRVNTPYISLVGENKNTTNINFYDEDVNAKGGSMGVRAATYIQKGATGFSAENLTFENNYEYIGDSSIEKNEQADAIRVDADEAVFVNCDFYGYQDTLNAQMGKQYYYKCNIYGNVDYIYGGANALFEDCDLVFRYNANKNSGYIAAPSTDINDYGYIFYNSRVLAENGCSGDAYYLARPWRADAAVTFIESYMSGIINEEEPYTLMGSNAYEDARFNEYYTYGEGFAINENRTQISKSQANEMLTEEFLGWNPQATAKFVSNSYK